MKPSSFLPAAGVLALLVFASAAPSQSSTTRPPVTGRLERMFKETRTPRLECGVVAGWADEEKPFFEHQPEAPLIPASNQKLITAAAAVLLLGMQHEVKTELIGHGAIENGELRGALRVRGEGDPTFGARDHGETLTKLAFFAERLKLRGIKRISGNVLVDDSAFDQDFVGVEWPSGDSRTTSYLGQVAALSVDDGCVRVMVTPGTVGRAPTLAVVPDVGHVTLRNGVTTAASKGGGLRFERDEGSNEISVTGTIARGSAPQRHDVAIHDPAMHFGRALLCALRNSGIEVSGTVVRASAEERKGGEVLLRYCTPLSLILPAMLKESINARAEMVAKHVGWVTGAGGTFAGAATAAKKALEGAGVDCTQLVLADGSGLSRRNRLTSRALHGVLVALARHPAGAEFRESLAEPGEEGTLRRRFTGLEDRLCAKTGTLNGVSALSGYVLTKSRRWVVFAILMNGYDPNVRKLQDSAVELLASIDGEG
jgi:D-alanyl-D-alanine carboxypeptidase/D-alanyl-D-alanine-endopeptidase (penicillin-binding protein 4)